LIGEVEGVEGEGRAAAAEEMEIWAAERERRCGIPRSRRRASAWEGEEGKSIWVGRVSYGLG
jgi:hypothetical protein